MGFLGTLFGGGASSIIDAVGKAIDANTTSDEERLSAKHALETLKQKPAELQVELNKIEARHPNIFVAGWRPFIGWVCGIGLSFTFILNPIIQWVTGKPGPDLPTSVIVDLVIALLGLGALRTIDKIKKVNDRH